MKSGQGPGPLIVTVDGDERAFNLLVDRHQGRLLNYLSRTLRDRERLLYTLTRMAERDGRPGPDGEKVVVEVPQSALVLRGQ